MFEGDIESVEACGAVVGHSVDIGVSAQCQLSFHIDVAIHYLGIVEREVGHDIVGSEVGVGGIVLIYLITSALGAVVYVAAPCPLCIDGDVGVIHRVGISDRVDMHAGIIGAHCLKTPVFIAGVEYELRQMLIYGAVTLHALGMLDDAACVGATVAHHLYDEVGIGITHHFGCAPHGQCELLRCVVEAAVGASIGASGHADIVFGHLKPHLEQHAIRVLFVVDLPHVIARHKWLQPAFGADDIAVVDVVHVSVARVAEVFKLVFVEAVYIFRLHKARGLPVGVAMQQAAAQIATVVGNLVKGEYQFVACADAHQRCVHQVAIARDGECAEHRVECRTLRKFGGDGLKSCHSRQEHYGHEFTHSPEAG